MNYNQKILERALKEEMNKANITYNKYREILDTCKVALNDESNALYVLYSLVESELIPVRVFQDVRTFFYKVEVNETVEKDFICKLIDELFSIYQKGLIDNTLWRFLECELTSYIGKHYRGISGANPGVVIADEMHTHIQPGGVFDKFKNLVQVKKNKKDEAVHVPADAIVKPTVHGSINFKSIEGLKFIKEPDEKDEYAEIAARLNEIADKVNSLYPLVKRIDTDSYIIKSGLGLKGVKPGDEKQVNVKKELDDYPLTKRQLDQVTDYVKGKLNAINTTVHYSGSKLTEEEKEKFVKDIQNELAKSIREDRIKGNLK